ncbi:hypothetical protein K0M31_012639 [Melipona bicolor]|uniref:Uncharacterized protein n=1 Tax=Melipona bicolor TaxID=60889 RepID=A0AA40FK50_9HYME|nr:hypothetical protein K0M31_012639 [Melipona bicolor]
MWPGFYWLSWGYASMGHHRVRAFIIDQENVVCGVSMVLQQFEVGQLKGDAVEMLKPSRLHVPICNQSNDLISALLHSRLVIALKLIEKFAAVNDIKDVGRPEVFKDVKRVRKCGTWQYQALRPARLNSEEKADAVDDRRRHHQSRPGLPLSAIALTFHLCTWLSVYIVKKKKQKGINASLVSIAV